MLVLQIPKSNPLKRVGLLFLPLRGLNGLKSLNKIPPEGGIITSLFSVPELASAHRAFQISASLCLDVGHRDHRAVTVLFQSGDRFR